MEKIIYQLKPIKPEKTEGPFYIVDCFPYPQFVMDEEGIPKSFDSYEEAGEEAKECQQGMVIVFD